METKTAKIVSVQENRRNYNSQNGQAFVHMIKFEGSDHEWEYHSKKNVCEKFKVGDTTTFDIEIKQNGQYTNYKIKPRQETPSNYNKQGGGMKDEGRITALSCIGSACIAVQQSSNSTNAEVILGLAERFFQFAISKSSVK